MSTRVARWPASGPHWYATSKAVVTAFSKGLADEPGPRGIRVNTVSPALIRTPLWDEYGPRISQARGSDFQQLMANLPEDINVTLGRWGTRKRSPTSSSSSVPRPRATSPAATNSSTAD